ncbi:hypothetical protein LguiB_022011 [Lonicera macranthoides]
MNFMRIVTLPIRVLGKARDFYMKTMFDCAGRIGEGSVVVGCSAPPQVSHLPRNFSGSSLKEGRDMEDLRELIRVMSMRNNNSNGINVMTEISGKREVEWRKQAVEGGVGGVGRCYSVGVARVGRIGRIDEELPCDFEEVDVKKDVFPLRKM